MVTKSFYSFFRRNSFSAFNYSKATRLTLNLIGPTNISIIYEWNPKFQPILEMKHSSSCSGVSETSPSIISTQNISDTSSIRSNLSTATTLKDSMPSTKTEFSPKLKTKPKSVVKTGEFEKQAVHHEAMASYFSMRWMLELKNYWNTSTITGWSYWLIHLIYSHVPCL